MAGNHGLSFDNLLGGQAEEEEILGANLFADFNIGAVQRANGQGAVERELHIAGATGFLAGGRDLFTEICGRVDALRVLNVEVGAEHDLDAVPHAGS